ncbi:MAG: DUF454 domain-containing protein [Tissierellia bacterium]|nr:DUF454 domain-containing protein [Tissierellia bacterium]
MKIFNILLIVLGLSFFLIGVIGVVVPVLPTTPFLILSSVLFAKSSPRFDSWLRGTKVFKDYAVDFIRERAMTRNRKIKLMMLSDFMLAFPLFILDNIYIKLFIILVILFKYYYFIFKIKTIKG